MKTIGENIANLRKSAGLTQEELAEKMNVTAQAVSKWENDLSYPDIICTSELAKLFGVSVDQIINGRNNIPTVMSAEPEKIDKRILIIKVDTNGNNVIVRFPVKLILKAAEEGNLEKLLGNNAEKVEAVIGMIREGTVGPLIDVDDGKGTKVNISVEYYES